MHYELPLVVPIAIQVHVHDLIEAGDVRKATRVLLSEGQLNRAEAAQAVEVLRSGGVLPDFPIPDQTDLATRARALRDSGRRKHAIFTVRSERDDMGPDDAEAFVDSL